MNDQETITDIIAEKRLRAAEMEKTLGDQHSFVESLKDDADRIEAALKRERGDCAKSWEALVKAQTALPARNCDRFASAEEAWNAYDEWVESCRAKGQTPAFNEFGWLFAAAAEKEGGAK